MLFSSFLLWSYIFAISLCADSSSSSNSQIFLSGSSITGPITGSSEAASPTGSYVSYSSTITALTTSRVLGSMTNVATSIGTGNVSASIPTDVVSTSSSQIILQGSVTTAINGTGSANYTASSTSSSAQPTNTTPCNNYPEFCSRQYSNITEVSAHNSPL